MPKAKEFDVERPLPVVDDEDDATLAAIDKGARDAKAGRTVPAEKVRNLLRQWITAFSSHEELPAGWYGQAPKRGRCRSHSVR